MGLEAKNPFENDDFVSEAAGDVEDVLLGIHHVALAVPVLDDAVDEYRDSFGIWVDHREVLDTEATEVAVLKVGGDTVWLLAPTADDSPLATFLEQRGPGLHHLGYRVEDAAAAVASMANQGHEVVEGAPRRGPGGTTVAFVHPHTMFGTLIALVQDP